MVSAPPVPWLLVMDAWPVTVSAETPAPVVNSPDVAPVSGPLLQRRREDQLQNTRSRSRSICRSSSRSRRSTYVMARLLTPDQPPTPSSVAMPSPMPEV